jgi:hypothetical protein
MNTNKEIMFVIAQQLFVFVHLLILSSFKSLISNAFQHWHNR